MIQKKYTQSKKILTSQRNTNKSMSINLQRIKVNITNGKKTSPAVVRNSTQRPYIICDRRNLCFPIHGKRNIKKNPPKWIQYIFPMYST